MLILRTLNGAALSMLLPVVQSFIAARRSADASGISASRRELAEAQDLTTSDDVGQVCGKAGRMWCSVCLSHGGKFLEERQRVNGTGRTWKISLRCTVLLTSAKCSPAS